MKNKFYIFLFSVSICGKKGLFNLSIQNNQKREQIENFQPNFSEISQKINDQQKQGEYSIGRNPILFACDAICPEPKNQKIISLIYDLLDEKKKALESIVIQKYLIITLESKIEKKEKNLFLIEQEILSKRKQIYELKEIQKKDLQAKEVWENKKKIQQKNGSSGELKTLEEKIKTLGESIYKLQQKYEKNYEKDTNIQSFKKKTITEKNKKIIELNKATNELELQKDEINQYRIAKKLNLEEKIRINTEIEQYIAKTNRNIEIYQAKKNEIDNSYRSSFQKTQKNLETIQKKQKNLIKNYIAQLSGVNQIIHNLVLEKLKMEDEQIEIKKFATFFLEKFLNFYYFCDKETVEAKKKDFLDSLKVYNEIIDTTIKKIEEKNTIIDFYQRSRQQLIEMMKNEK